MRTVRRGVFETNSSSTHSLTIVSKEEYDKCENGELLFSRYDRNFVENTAENREDEDYKTCKDFWDDIDMETFHTNKTINGVDVVAFGYYGYDG